MFQVGETVVYGTTGVCTILSIGPLSMHGVDRHRLYYTLQPLHQEGAIYIPVEGEHHKAMRYPITEEAAEQFLDRLAEIPPCDIEGLNFKQRTDAFTATLQEADCEGWLGVIKAVAKKKRFRREKQQYNVDYNFYKKAMKLLCMELGYVLHKSEDSMRKLIEACLAQAAREAKEAQAAEMAEAENKEA